MMKRLVIVGATSAIAEHCARLWVKESAVDLTLIGRDMDKLQMVADDLRVRSPDSVIHTVTADFIDPAAVRLVVDQITASGPVQLVLIAHGTLPDQQQCQNDLAVGQQALIINGLSPVLFAEAFAGHLQAANGGTLAVIGSVAGDRGRKSNYVYGAAKGLVTRYVQGLQHRLARSGVQVVLIKPGPTDTPMTAHLKQQGMALASAEQVAQAIVDGIAKGAATIYAPAKWKLIMLVIRHLPNFIFNRMDI